MPRPVDVEAHHLHRIGAADAGRGRTARELRIASGRPVHLDHERDLAGVAQLGRLQVGTEVVRDVALHVLRRVELGVGLPKGPLRERRQPRCIGGPGQPDDDAHPCRSSRTR